ncbi:gp83 [Mycobacterium phage Barnyard]|uniref:Uncharacterized protein n=1 Tax=Mycobacterium phage Barnyard TaxID=205880 RepID=Q855Y9_9CAUD|nr:gp83 [Mycobacterium phage Barnyard]AAN02137.1 hypothetical protein PBI_BARNYARD_83 [Mycobacterium phage Barnyard]
MGQYIKPYAEGETPKGECLPGPHVHCEFCTEHVISTVPSEIDALRDMLIHIRDDHKEAWLSEECREYRENAWKFGVESL